ncbi:beta-fructofuranosidase, insoluble isoenzyme 1-like [Impatiens glandulifera]|uniref:beta-fructofuranosidase, insoluble isoenzyme 1-like n=1 Tax=Impatiens glandulifera TaxID=253017 RepID=UPI001FB08EC9|nr:beta-fructofuranosidase, insoluble isoenzyme 1-like [Impatiens glandulifera]
MYFKGLYHLFYQYNPKGAVWGNIVWAHSVSTDLINWKPLNHAIYPSKPFDQFGCWSGSATILPGNKPVILYTGIIDGNQTQVQNYAIPANYSDPYLREWVKPDNNPIISAVIGVNRTAFRDPTTAWFNNGHWKIVVGGRRRERGMTHLYRSRDFVRWTKAQHPLHSKAGTGMWECPDFFPVSKTSPNGVETSMVGSDMKHVLKVSLDETRFEYYTIGSYDLNVDRYYPDDGFVDGRNGLRFDYGNFYASKTFFDSVKNRRILWGWSNESDTTNQDKEKGWAGIQTIPRKLWLDPSGKQLLQWPIEELEELREEKVEYNHQLLNIGDVIEITGITPAQADVEVSFSFESLNEAEEFDPKWSQWDAQELCKNMGSTKQGGLGPFGLLTLASRYLEEYTSVFFRVFKAQDKHVVLMCSDATSSSLDGSTYKPSLAGFVNVDLTKKMKLSLRTLIDHSVVESFGEGGKTCITSRVYPKLAVMDKAYLYAFNNGSTPVHIEDLNAWTLKKPMMMN